MAKVSKKRNFLEDENGVIKVNWYYRQRFEKDISLLRCSNCNAEINYKQVYELENGKVVNLCYHCTQKVHNLSTKNPKFRRY